MLAGLVNVILWSKIARISNNKANSMLGIIKRKFRNINQVTFIMLYKSLVRCHLEYANSVWNPYQIQFIKALEKVQMRATRLIYKLRNKSYEERFRTLDLPEYKRLRSDMTETYKILSEKYN